MKARGVCRWAAVMLTGALAAGVTSCGGGGGSSGGGGSMTITPTQAPNTVSVRITDGCDDSADIEWRIFSYSTNPASGRPAGVLPAQDRVYMTSGLGVQPSAELVNCGAHRSVCYGGRRRGDTSGRYWGAGVGGDQSCSNCCVACSTSAGRSLNRRLTCASDGTPAEPVVVELPDLDVRDFSVSDTTPAPGQRITLRATVYNYGFADRSPSTTLRYYRSTDSSITRSDTAEGSDSVNSLSPGSSSSESTVVTAPSSGTWYYGACVGPVAGERDPSDDCTESGEAVRVVVDVPSRPAARPDLDVRDFSVSDTTPAPGQRITLRATVYNYNFADRSPSTTLRYYRSTNSNITRSDTAVGSDSVNALSPGSSSSESTVVNAPSSGTWYYGACVDQVAGERDPSDDCTESGEAVRVVVGSSSPVTPPAVGGGRIRFTLTDQCRRPGALNARFFGYVGTSTAGRAQFVWPSSSRVYTTGNRRTVGDSIDVTLGESGRGIGIICYGAQLEGDSDRYWGVGLDGDEGCSDCCIRVPASGTVRDSRDLTCP